MAKHPTDLPDTVARKQAEAAIAAAHEDTRRALLAAREAKTDG
jgi:hypothetical protein